MKIIFTKHAERKFKFLKELGWSFKPKDIEKVLGKPDSVKQGYSGAKVALKSLSKTHDLRIVYSDKGDIITIITFYPVRRNRYDQK